VKYSPLYRILYVREGTLVGQTFWAKDVVAAVEYGECFERESGFPVLTIKPLGVSTIDKTGEHSPSRVVTRLRLLKENFWPTRYQTTNARLDNQGENNAKR